MVISSQKFFKAARYRYIVPFFTSIGVQYVKMSPFEHVNCVIEYCYCTIKINVAYQNNDKQMKEYDNTS